MMKHLFVARHGDYGFDDRLTGHGRQQFENLSKVVKHILNGATAYIISSTAPRALDSAEILVVELGLPKEFEKTPYLWSATDAPLEEGYDDDLGKLMGLVNERRDKADSLIMVTHLEVVRDFPTYFFNAEFGGDEYLIEPHKGEAVHINLEARTHQLLP
ncbi:histidine phosphatase family protein [Candidatus Woesearchaeota archaeon]|nr:histidine phosphatase family protein [Candidatus Woesearchaeota archaeon]